MGETSAFLDGARAWIYDGALPDACPTCGFEWSIPVGEALARIDAAADRYADLLQGRDGMAPARDGGWNASAYLWHLTDLARSWSERWIQVAADPGSTLVGWDPDELAEARNYRRLPTSSATWALREATATFVTLTRSIDADTPFQHGEWGAGNVADGTRWLAHEYTHHLLDVDERAADH